MTICNSLHPRADVDRLYVPRKALSNIHESARGRAESKQILLGYKQKGTLFLIFQIPMMPSCYFCTVELEECIETDCRTFVFVWNVIVTAAVNRSTTISMTRRPGEIKVGVEAVNQFPHLLTIFEVCC